MILRHASMVYALAASSAVSELLALEPTSFAAASSTAFKGRDRGTEFTMATLTKMARSATSNELFMIWRLYTVIA